MKDWMKSIDDAATYIEKRLPSSPRIGLVLGSGLGTYAKERDLVRIRYADIPHFPRASVAGHAGELCLAEISGVPTIIMRGRVHTYEGYSPQEVAFPIRVMKRLGVSCVVLTNAAGAINTDFSVGDLVLVSDHINFAGITPLTGPNIDELGPRFPGMSHVYSPRRRREIMQRAKELGVDLKEGVYIFFPGPQFETPAEIRAARVLGADLVGMSTVPEAVAAKHARMRVVAISCVTNMAAGIGEENFSHMDVVSISEKVEEPLTKLLDAAIPLV
nr:purine-nucleoside phosphorylase [Maliibacterium massiliense]